MKYMFRASLVLGILLFVNTHSVLADSATFSASSFIRITVRQTPGITVELQGSAVLPTPTPQQVLSGVVTKFPPATQEIPDPFSLRLTFREIAGQAGLTPGFARVTQTGSSSSLILRNVTDHEITVTIDYDLTTLLTTSATGAALADAQFEFAIIGDGAIIFSDHFASHGNGSFSLSRGGPIPFSIPARGSGEISLTGTQIGLADVPEPTAMVLLGTGLTGMAIKLRKKFKIRPIKTSRN